MLLCLNEDMLSYVVGRVDVKVGQNATYWY